MKIIVKSPSSILFLFFKNKILIWNETYNNAFTILETPFLLSLKSLRVDSFRF